MSLRYYRHRRASGRGTAKSDRVATGTGGLAIHVTDDWICTCWPLRRGMAACYSPRSDLRLAQTRDSAARVSAPSVNERICIRFRFPIIVKLCALARRITRKFARGHTVKTSHLAPLGPAVGPRPRPVEPSGEWKDPSPSKQCRDDSCTGMGSSCFQIRVLSQGRVPCRVRVLE